MRRDLVKTKFVAFQNNKNEKKIPAAQEVEK